MRNGIAYCCKITICKEILWYSYIECLACHPTGNLHFHEIRGNAFLPTRNIRMHFNVEF